MRRALLTLGVVFGVLAGGLVVSGTATAAAEQAETAVSAPVARTAPRPAADGCKDPNNWWDNLRLNAGSMPTCDTNLDWPWQAGDANCTVTSNGQGIPEMVNCTGTTPTTSGALECWINVPTKTNGAAAETTVCTSSTDQTHRDTIRSTTGKDPEQLQGHCGVGDAVCGMFEGWSRALMSDAIGSMVSVVGTGHFSTEGPLWDAAAGEWSYWVWAVLGVMVIATVWAIVAAMYSRDRADMVTAIVRSFIGWPATLLTYWLGSRLVGIFDDWTLYTLTRGDSLAGVFRRFSQIIYAGGEGHYFMTFLIALAIWIGTKLLIVVFALRTLGLAVLLMAGPVAWMMFAVKNIGPQWVVGYMSAGFTLLLAGPLTMGFLMLILRGLGNVKVLWSPEAWPLLLGLILVVFAPFAVMSLFSFAGAATADRLGSAAANAGRMGMNMARGASRHGSNAMQRAMRWAPAGRSNARPAGQGGDGRQGGGRGDRKGPGSAGRSNRQNRRGRERSDTNKRPEPSSTPEPPRRPKPAGRGNR